MEPLQPLPLSPREQEEEFPLDEASLQKNQLQEFYQVSCFSQLLRTHASLLLWAATPSPGGWFWRASAGAPHLGGGADMGCTPAEEPGRAAAAQGAGAG
ncbi:uncharacterized protein LOC143663323 isoform X4 [Tamandua tetradactyla]|uniref:uncharacterized protein LOC143663323 isoform X4 n=1 Tax=Tamandua tetradactyla TaxID=48850 RepID=UPI004053E274